MKLFNKIINFAVFNFRKHIFSVNKIIEAEFNLTKSIREIEPSIKINCEKISKSHLGKLSANLPPNKIEKMKRRLNKDFYGFALITESGKIASYGWITFKDDYDSSTGILMKATSETAIFIDAFTFPEFRGKKLQSYLTARRLELLKSMNYKKCIAAYLDDNCFSRKNFISAGFSETFKWTVINLFGYKKAIKYKIKD
ncbi:MAG: hypothetical protein GXX85_08190 [Ignavibacteria bacterium]|nr:hypothetical protein [Ignavibacteria bacterium]